MRPVQPQDDARLLVIYGDGRLVDAQVLDLPDFLSAGDALVFNDTRVLPAALKGRRPARDALGQDVACDVNLVEQISAVSWAALARPGKRLKTGDTLLVGEGFSAEIVGKRPGGEIELTFHLAEESLETALSRHGAMPLPPYIARRRPADERDKTTYQTGYASDDAKSVAAPTAGLHFTQRLLARVEAAGLIRETVRLHVGLGTFSPLEQSQLDAGRLHEEWRRVSAETANRLNHVRASGRRCVPVGTTALRCLESACTSAGVIEPVTGPTDIFLRPGDTLTATDALVTNFHLPRSSLFMLVCALAGTDIMQAAYRHAIDEGYRFYSYGDACLILP